MINLFRRLFSDIVAIRVATGEDAEGAWQLAVVAMCVPTMSVLVGCDMVLARLTGRPELFDLLGKWVYMLAVVATSFGLNSWLFGSMRFDEVAARKMVMSRSVTIKTKLVVITSIVLLPVLFLLSVFALVDS